MNTSDIHNIHSAQSLKIDVLVKQKHQDYLQDHQHPLNQALPLGLQEQRILFKKPNLLQYSLILC